MVTLHHLSSLAVLLFRVSPADLPPSECYSDIFREKRHLSSLQPAICYSVGPRLLVLSLNPTNNQYYSLIITHQ